MISHGRRKAKGSTFERDLVHKFWDAGWGAARIAGSGSTRLPAPDIIVGKPGRIIVIEAKASADKKKYLTSEEVDQLILLAKSLGAEPWIAVKFNGLDIKFCPANSAKRTEKSVVVSADDSLLLTFDELIAE